MPSCSFIMCTNSSRTKNKAQGYTFHSFPQDDLLRHKWLLVVRKQRKEPDWMPTNNSRICCIHFRTEDMYTTNKGYRKLYKCAVPYFRGMEAEAMEAANNSRSRSMSPNSLDNVDISDLESIFDTPRKTFLKEKLSKATMRNQRLMLDNINLKKKNKRLNRTCKSLKETVAQLRKKLTVSEEQFVELSFKQNTKNIS